MSSHPQEPASSGGARKGSPKAPGPGRGRWRSTPFSPTLITAIGPCAWPSVLRFCRNDTAPRLYRFLAMNCDASQFITIDYEAVARYLEISPLACLRAAQRLAKWNLLRRVSRGGGRGKRTIWRVTLLPLRDKKTDAQKHDRKVLNSRSTLCLTAKSDTSCAVSPDLGSSVKGQVSQEKWRKAIVMKARLALMDTNATASHKDALLRLFGKGVFQQRWPLSVARRVLWALPALAQSSQAPPPSAPIRRVYAAFAAILKPSIEAGWDMFQSWLNFYRPGAPYGRCGLRLTNSNSQGVPPVGAQATGGAAGLPPGGAKGEEAEPCLTGSMSGRIGERRSTSVGLGSSKWGGSPVGEHCRMARPIGASPSTSAGGTFPPSLRGPLPSWNAVHSPVTSEQESSSCMRREAESGMMFSASGLEISSAFVEWLAGRHPFTWRLILRDRVRLTMYLREWRDKGAAEPPPALGT